eukprot:gene22365-26982_t
MDDADYERQINQMVQFIKQEAGEKANEISVAAEEEFNLKKLNMVDLEKKKMRQEFERKDSQIEVQKKIEYSSKLNEARLKVLQARDVEVQKVLAQARAELAKVCEDKAGYTKLLEDLIIQAALKLQINEVGVRCREMDLPLVKTAINNVKSKFTNVTGKKCPSIALDEKTFLPPPDGDVTS